MDPSEPMRVKVRSGYAFHRITRYVNSDGSLRKEKVSEVIVGPAEITVTAEELQSQEHNNPGASGAAFNLRSTHP